VSTKNWIPSSYRRYFREKSPQISAVPVREEKREEKKKKSQEFPDFFKNPPPKLSFTLTIFQNRS
jgi:hypothetical protein